MPIKIKKCNREWTGREILDYLNVLGQQGAFGSSWKEGKPWRQADIQKYMLELGAKGAFGSYWVPPADVNHFPVPHKVFMVSPNEIYIGLRTIYRPVWEAEAKPEPKSQPRPVPIETSCQQNLLNLAGNYARRLIEERFAWDESSEMQHLLPEFRNHKQTLSGC